jgi:predicted aminopeptidase
MSCPTLWKRSRKSGRSSSAPSERPRLKFFGPALATLLCGAASACSPLYVIRAGIAEARILSARRPLAEVVVDPAVDARTRGKLVLAIEARAWARDTLHLDVGDAYTSFTQLESDTLALVLSAAYKDRLASRTWWFPIVGHVPYRGFFDDEEALAEQRELDAQGFDTYLRPTSAFSTLGWFADPLLSSIVREDEVDLIETILHELSHNHLFVPGQVRFNESFATFVGRAGAIDFFCRRQGGGPDTVRCLRAQARWRDYQRFSRWLDGLVEDLQALYADASLSTEQKVRQREQIAAAHRDRFATLFQPAMESYTTWGFVERPLNNAVLLGQMLYYHRLGDFQALLDANRGDLAATIAGLAERAGSVADPFELLPRTGEPGEVAPAPGP